MHGWMVDGWMHGWMNATFYWTHRHISSLLPVSSKSATVYVCLHLLMPNFNIDVYVYWQYKKPLAHDTLESLTKDHPDGGPPWWETTLLRDHPDERPPLLKTTLMKDHFDEGTPWWETTLMKDHPGERLPWWKSTLMRDHPGERPPGERPPWWKATLRRDHPDERPTWWETTLRKVHPDERPPLFQGLFFISFHSYFHLNQPLVKGYPPFRTTLGWFLWWSSKRCFTVLLFLCFDLLPRGWIDRKKRGGGGGI